MLKLKKSLSQNFLIDKNIINKIINLETLSNKKVFEIGPGSGNLTDFIVNKKPKSLCLIEKDKRFYEILKERYRSLDGCTILNKDILDYNLNEHKDQNVIVFGNLPYNISTQILAKFIKISSLPPFYKKMIFMFQSEVADRIMAKQNTKNFSRITVLTNFKLDIVGHFKVSKKCFFPIPKVDSTIIVFQPKKKIDYKISNIENLEKITQIFFSNRRKMINKSIINLFGKNTGIAEKLKINMTSRPSELSSEIYYKITEIYEKFKNI